MLCCIAITWSKSLKKTTCCNGLFKAYKSRCWHPLAIRVSARTVLFLSQQRNQQLYEHNLELFNLHYSALCNRQCLRMCFYSSISIDVTHFMIVIDFYCYGNRLFMRLVTMVTIVHLMVNVLYSMASVEINSCMCTTTAIISQHVRKFANCDTIILRLQSIKA